MPVMCSIAVSSMEDLERVCCIYKDMGGSCGEVLRCERKARNAHDPEVGRNHWHPWTLSVEGIKSVFAFPALKRNGRLHSD